MVLAAAAAQTFIYMLSSVSIKQNVAKWVGNGLGPACPAPPRSQHIYVPKLSSALRGAVSMASYGCS